jgi:hypothetical protein
VVIHNLMRFLTNHPPLARQPSLERRAMSFSLPVQSLRFARRGANLGYLLM